MTTITLPRATVEQALEALEDLADCGAEAWSEQRPCVQIGREAIANLRSALAQQAEPVEPPKPAPLKRGTTGRCTRKVCECEKEGLGPECIHLEPVIDGYPLWSGIPKAEPVYWEVRCTAHPKWMRVDEQQFDEYVAHGWEGQRLYTAPPRRTMVPLTDEEIDALPWNGSPRQFARAVEKASWEKNYGQA